MLTLQRKPLDPAHKLVRGAVRHQVRWDLLAAFISPILKNQAGVQVPDFEFRVLELQVHHQVSADHVGHPVSQAQVHCGLICIKDVGLQGQQGVNPRAGMQMLSIKV